MRTSIGNNIQDSDESDDGISIGIRWMDASSTKEDFKHLEFCMISSLKMCPQ